MNKKEFEEILKTMSRTQSQDIEINVVKPSSIVNIFKDRQKQSTEIKKSANLTPFEQYETFHKKTVLDQKQKAKLNKIDNYFSKKNQQIKKQFPQPINPQPVIQQMVPHRFPASYHSTNPQIFTQKLFFDKSFEPRTYNKSILQQLEEVKMQEKNKTKEFMNKMEKKRNKQGLKNLERYKKLDQNLTEQKPKELSQYEKQRLVEQKIRKQYAVFKKPKQTIKAVQQSQLQLVFGKSEQPKNNDKYSKPVVPDTKITDLGYIHFQRNNYNALLRVILSHGFANELLMPQVKKVPNIFQEKQAYLKIFEFLIINETIASLHNSFRIYRNTENYKKPYPVKLKLSKKTDDGFYMFEAKENSYLQQVQYTQLKNLSLSKFNLVLISKRNTFENQRYSTEQFKKDFVFMGCLITPQNKAQLAANVRILSCINSKSFIRQHSEDWIQAYVFQFDKISTFVREFLAVRNIQFQDLAQFIYNPPLMTKYAHNYITYPEIFQNFFQRLDGIYNETQLNSIKELSLRDKGIIMLQGPPGTGKTSTLLGVLAAQYHYLSQIDELGKIKILICTPSNTAIDHIVKRLVNEGLVTAKGKNIIPKVLRIGLLESNDEDLRSVYLDHLIEKELLIQMQDVEIFSKWTIPQIKDHVTVLYKEIKKLEFSLKEPGTDNLDQIRQKINKKISERQNLQTRAYQLRKQRIDQKSKYHEIQRRLLNKAQIICTTLSSTGSDRLQKFKGKFACLIVDQAGQCTEPNLLIAMQLNINKVLLIGDPCQLPATTFSPDCNVTLYNRSMFERMIDAGLKPYFLDIQYRMTNQIRSFPSKFFYGNRLKDAEVIQQRKYPAHLKEFKNHNVLFIDVKFGSERLVDKSYQNQSQCNVVKSICDFIDSDKLSVGIITPYKQQMKRLTNLLRGKPIFVNTIDSFQGQQKDVIIISTVRANTSDSDKRMGFLVDQRRINVALTRSKFLLIIVGNADTLGSNEVWNQFLNQMVAKNGYYKLSDKQNYKFSLNKLLEGDPIESHMICSRIKYSKLSRDIRKMDRQEINLEDFGQKPEIQQKKEEEMYQGKLEWVEKQQKQVQYNKPEINSEAWNVETAMMMKQRQMKQRMGADNKSLLDMLLFM